MGCTKCNTDCNTCPCTCGCENTLSTTCLQYTGETLECIGVSTGEMVESIFSKLNDKFCDVNGVDGLSAYEIAVGLGFLGTESEWIASLQGADADTTGFSAEDNGDGTITFTFPDGSTFTTPNLNGAQGDSAYEVWLSEGNVGTEADFLASLEGAQGSIGDPATNNFKLLYTQFTEIESSDPPLTFLFPDTEINGAGDILTIDFNLRGTRTSSGTFTLTGSANTLGYPIISKTLGGGLVDDLYHVTITFVQTGTGLSGSAVYTGLPETIMIDTVNFTAGVPNGGDYGLIFTVSGTAGDFAIDDLVIIRKKV